MSEITAEQKKQLLKLEGFKQIQKQFAKENQAGAGKRRMSGKGFWENVGSWFKSVGTSVNDFLKKTKILSNVAGAVLPLLAPLGTALLTANPIAAAASVGVAKGAAEGIRALGYGYGSKSMMKRKMHGGELSNKLVINPVGQRLMGKGNDTFGINGVQQQHNAPMHSGIMKTIKGSGGFGQNYKLKGLNKRAMVGSGGIPYGSISSEFGNMKF